MQKIKSPDKVSSNKVGTITSSNNDKTSDKLLDTDQPLMKNIYNHDDKKYFHQKGRKSIFSSKNRILTNINKFNILNSNKHKQNDSSKAISSKLNNKIFEKR